MRAVEVVPLTGPRATDDGQELVGARVPLGVRQVVAEAALFDRLSAESSAESSPSPHAAAVTAVRTRAAMSVLSRLVVPLIVPLVMPFLRE
ncbi:hypothetical protein [Actinomadura sp. HBU206391]|uniref:hypothetical protein n=1 Tax=Actinomadura sp. HBU206391 TaxID=2731692 RepID=UPI001C9D01D5